MSKKETINYEAIYSQVAHTFLNIVEQIQPLDPQAKILDLGCGEGYVVKILREKGYSAFGCDFIDDQTYKNFTNEVLKKFETGILIPIPTPYRLPFENNSFDYIFSADVFEHVMDYQETLDEIYRLLKPGGMNINMFPSRYRFLEAHVHVPFASIIRNKNWLYLWALLGIRNEFQINKKASEVAQLNYNFLHNHTNYPTSQELLSYTHKFSSAEFREDLFLYQNNSSKGKMINKVNKIIPIVPELISKFHRRVLVLRK